MLLIGTGRGLFKSQEEIDNSPEQNLGSVVKPGDIKYRDINGDGKIDDNDQVMLSPVIDSTLGQRCRSIIGYQFSEIVRSLRSVYFCGGSCVEGVTSQLMRHLSYHPTLRTCSSDTILRAIKELTKENIS